MRSYCWYRNAVETRLGFGYSYLSMVLCTWFFTAWKQIIASHIIQNKAAWPNLEQSRRCWCRHSVACCLAGHLWSVVGFAQLFLMFALRIPYKTRGTQSEEQLNSSAPHSVLRSSICQPLLWVHPTFPVKLRLEPVSKSKDCKETSWLYPLPITEQSPDISAQECCLDQEQGDVPWPHFLQATGEKTSLERQPFCTSSCSHTAQCWLSRPRGMAELLHLSWTLKVQTLPWSHSASILYVWLRSPRCYN